VTPAGDVSPVHSIHPLTLHRCVSQAAMSIPWFLLAVVVLHAKVRWMLYPALGFMFTAERRRHRCRIFATFASRRQESLRLFFPHCPVSTVGRQISVVLKQKHYVRRRFTHRVWRTISRVCAGRARASRGSCIGACTSPAHPANGDAPRSHLDGLLPRGRRRHRAAPFGKLLTAVTLLACLPVNATAIVGGIVEHGGRFVARPVVLRFRQGNAL
jgi:hypothetical protein